MKPRSHPPQEAWAEFLGDLNARRVRPGPSDDVPRVEDLIQRIELGAGTESVLVSSKPWALRLVEQRGRRPRGLGLLLRSGLATPEFSTLLRRIVTPWKMRLFFVGDLDPLDLAAFRALQLGDPFLCSGGRAILPLRYAGIDSAWLERCLEAGGERCCIALSSFERREWAALRTTWRGVGRIIGRSATELLDRGYKLELEGASTPRLYPPAHLQWIRERLSSF